ncbi:hypothetical protein BDC45DRAFT_561775 [Circinella umbellata]|nr:hypothetical protein BDC45DRAFT_561775 [Circinella umbellata]
MIILVKIYMVIVAKKLMFTFDYSKILLLFVSIFLASFIIHKFSKGRTMLISECDLMQDVTAKIYFYHDPSTISMYHYCVLRNFEGMEPLSVNVTEKNASSKFSLTRIVEIIPVYKLVQILFLVALRELANKLGLLNNFITGPNNTTA